LHYIKFLFFVCASLLFFSQRGLADDTIKFDVKNYDITLDISDIGSQSIKGKCVITVCPRFVIKPDYLFFWLKALNVDSVFVNDIKHNFKHTNEIITIPTSLFQQHDSLFVSIYYQGKPVKDPYWGGFYFSSADVGYAFNMGVGFVDEPHNYGRVWFPCIDNFTDKATYSFHITTTSDKVAVCSGILINNEVLPNNKIAWHWRLNQMVSTYLVSVAVGKYAFVSDFYQGINKKHSILLASLASDTSKMKSSFTNLKSCINIYEEYYGPYLFDRVGYVVVPFNAGAMEHSCNIAYPKYAINGNLANETLMAHEFSHNWWGNLVTCSHAADMWINEGWASWSEWLFLEKKYGKNSYLAEMKDNQRIVLQYAHIIDGSVLPLSPMPSDVTYGRHVYDKGASIVHNLRIKMGDSLFFNSVRRFLNDKKFSSTNSYELRDSFSSYSGIDLTEFFNNFIFEPGFPHFSTEILSKGKTTVIEVYHKSRFNQQVYNDIPLEITFFDALFNQHTETVLMDGVKKSFSFQLPFSPEFAVINAFNGICEAKTNGFHKITKPATYNFGNGLMNLVVSNLTDSALVFVEHNWVGPDNSNTITQGIRFSDYRYWTVRGVFPSLFSAKGRLSYNGTEGNMNGADYLDHTLKIINEDSLVLLYRENINSSWRIYDNYNMISGSKSDKIGIIEINNFKAGDYCIGIRDYKVDNASVIKHSEIMVYPNPTENNLLIQSPDNYIINSLRLCDTNGRNVLFIDNIDSQEYELSILKIINGYYTLTITSGRKVFTQKIIINR